MHVFSRYLKSRDAFGPASASQVPSRAPHVMGAERPLVPASPEARAGPWWNSAERRGTLSVSETQL